MTYFNGLAPKLVADYAVLEGLHRVKHRIEISIDDWRIEHQAAILQILLDEATNGRRDELASDLFAEAADKDLFLNIGDPALFGRMWVRLVAESLHDEFKQLSYDATMIAKVNDAYDADMRRKGMSCDSCD